MEDLSKYENLKKDAMQFYNAVGKAYSPAFNQDVHFNAEGFNHIIFNGSRSERERSSQVLRFKLLKLGVKLIQVSTTYQEYEEMFKEINSQELQKEDTENKDSQILGRYCNH